jgi:hypothetical protein
MALPCLAAFLRGRAGRVRLPDIGLLLLSAWAAVALVANHGFGGQIEPIGIFFLETVVAYLIGRVYVSNAADFFYLVRLLFFTTIAMTPFAIQQAITENNLILSVFEVIGRSYDKYFSEQRLGFFRAQGAFQHPILFGVYCASVISLTYFVLCYRRGIITRFARTGIVLFTALTSLSSGPMAAMVAQLGMIGWNIVLRPIRARWWILAGLAIIAWVFVDIASNRSPPEVFISYFALNSATAYNRILIWIYGSASVMNNPLLGIGMGSWEQPSWMSDSMDMYWLVVPVRYGLPAGILNGLVFLSIFLGVALRRNFDARQNAYRLGFLSCMVGFGMVGWTVHFWNETYVLFMFLMGSGVWFLDVQPSSSRSEPLATRRQLEE